MSAIEHLIANLRGRSLKIRVGGSSEMFASPDEFIQFLGARLTVTSDSLDRFAHLDERGLRREARKMLHAYQNVMEITANAQQTGESLATLWRRLDISKVPDDHDWPSILFAMGNVEHLAEDYRRGALSQYMRFLEARRQAAESFRDHPKRAGGSDSSLTGVSNGASAGGPSASPSDAVLDSYSRLPHCHSVEVDLEDKPDITVFLGVNRYRLSKQGESLTLKESSAVQTYALKPGRNTVGRSSQCDIHLDGQQGDISRQHLIVEINAGRRVSLMDVSSRGTYVRPELLTGSRGTTLTGQNQ